MFRVMAFCLPNFIIACDETLLSWRWPNTCLRWEVMNKFFGLLCLNVWLLLYLLNCLHLSLCFLTFTFLILSLDSAAGESAWPPCQLRLSNNRSEVNTVVRFLHFHIIILDVSSGNLFFQTESLMADS